MGPEEEHRREDEDRGEGEGEGRDEGEGRGEGEGEGEDRGEGEDEGRDEGGHVGPPQPRFGRHNKVYGATLNAAMDWFKTMTTNEYIRGVKKLGWPRFKGKLWQRDYWERIIRNEVAYHNISNYIIKNPERWEDDMFSKPE